MVRSPNTTAPGSPHAATNIDMLLVHMERGHISGPCHYATATEGTRRLGHFGHRNQMLNITPQPIVDNAYAGRLRDDGYAAQMESGWYCGQSAFCKSHLCQDGLQQALRSGYGIYITPPNNNETKHKFMKRL